ncbi:formate/nitrite transporter family protein [Spiroplasma endosymbiont of Anurida maritima]|uniref:formate/nitrite transporter family protein n=1 Tax=Spiroplasma endosymbiont of Anurida maritima TaxID=2967972 RepID=UPI0036D2C750
MKKEPLTESEENLEEAKLLLASKDDEMIAHSTFTNESTFIRNYVFAIKKLNETLLKIFMLAIAAGMFIGLAYVAIGMATKGIESSGIASLISGLIFPLAIIMIVFIGGQLFTSNVMGLWPTIRRKVKVQKYLQNLIIVLIGNWIGILFLCLIVWGAGLFKHDAEYAAITMKYFDGKMKYTWIEIFFSGILCNLLVAGSVWISFSTNNTSAKIMLFILLIGAFVISGYSHVVANAFPWFSSMMIKGSSSENWSQFAEFGYKVQLPTLFGNYLGGAVILPGIFYIVWNKKLGNQ